MKTSIKSHGINVIDLDSGDTLKFNGLLFGVAEGMSLKFYSITFVIKLISIWKERIMEIFYYFFISSEMPSDSTSRGHTGLLSFFQGNAAKRVPCHPGRSNSIIFLAMGSCAAR
jgi:hypothetical protein